ncbi:head GIN domain-containing protein [Inhella sp.]|uniref:head GIN domain-containing protein n=1 Tax=Inhella sp. TaxID=1921806 RepID=UPI0035B301B7
MKPLYLSLVLMLPLAAWSQAQPVGKLYTPGPFDSLSFSGAAQVSFRQGDRDELFIEGDEDVQKDVRLQLRDGQLSLHTRGTWWFWRDTRLRVQVMARELKRLSVSGSVNFQAPEPVQLPELRVSISGAGLVRFDQLRTEDLKFGVSGAGDGQFAGQVQRLSLSISGRSDFLAQGLQVQQAKVSISGLGKAKLWVEQELEVSISGIGTVDHWGNAKVSRRSSGLATINGLGPKPAPPPAPASPAE